MVELLSLVWMFNTAALAQSSMTAQNPGAPLAAPANITNGFTVVLKVDMDKLSAAQPLLEIPGVVTLVFRKAGVDKAFENEDRRQNYLNFKMADGSTPVLEATLALDSFNKEWNRMRIGFPLAALVNGSGEKELVLNFDGAHWRFYCGGELMDEDFPVGYPPWKEAVLQGAINPACVKSAAFYAPSITPVAKEMRPVETVKKIQYFTPKAHNAWVGDVVTLYHDGRFHIFYLYDRRHHSSKFGKGAHYFEHLSSTDLINWVEHEAAAPLDEQWETIGTGTPFIYKDKFYLAYGLHTTRLYPREQTALPEQWDALNKNGKTLSLPRSATAKVPAGATCSVSDDGVHFTKSQIMFHPCENPGVFTDPDGKLKMIANFGAKGIWESDTPEGGWRCISPEFPPGGDCTFFFRWGSFDYIIGGFTGLWSKSVHDTAYASLVSQGLDFYDGVAVPAISEITGKNRFIMTGWIAGNGWGGHLVLRELVHYPDGRIGSHWLKEAMPETGRIRILAAKTHAPETVVTNDCTSFVLSFDGTSQQVKTGKLAVAFFNESEQGHSVEFQLRLGDARAQWNGANRQGFANPDVKTLREGGAPHDVGNFAIENLSGLDKPFSVRLLVLDDPKSGGSIIDAEIAGCRTMITFRSGLRAKNMVIRTDAVVLQNVTVAPLK